MITLPSIASRRIRFGLPTSSAPSGVIVAALIPKPASRIARAAASTTSLPRAAAVLEREVEVLELELDAEDVRVEHPQRLLEQLLAGLVALEHDYPGPVGHRPAIYPEERAAADDPSRQRCTWCGNAVEADDGFRLPSTRATAARSSAGSSTSSRGRSRARTGRRASRSSPPAPTRPRRCSHCGAELGDGRVLLVRHRGEHRIADGFCSVDHLREWAKAGGRWQ